MRAFDRQSEIGKRRRRGAVATELALLVPFVYLPLILGAIYVAWLAAARGRVHEANHYAVHKAGDQRELAAERGSVSQEFFREFPGEVIVFEAAADDPEVPGPREVRDLFEEYVRSYSWRREIWHRDAPPQPRAWGGFTLGGGGVTYQQRVEPGRPPRDPWLEVQEGTAYAHKSKAREVEQLGLLDDEIPEGLTEHMSDYMWRRQAQAIYRHRWLHDRDPVVAGAKGERAWNAQVPARDVVSRDVWQPEAAIRGSKVRQARDQLPPGAWVRSRLGCPSGLPGYELDSDFMHPK